MYLKSTQRPQEVPKKPDPANKKLLPDENGWVWDEFNELRSQLLIAIDPLEEYLNIYKKYEKEYKLNVEEYVSKKDPKEEEGEEPPEVAQIREDIYKHLEEEKRLKSEIPE